MVANQGWNEECSQPQTKGGMYTVKETDMLIAKMGILLNHLHERAEFKEHRNNYTQAMDSYMTCEVCGNGGHSRNDCPETREDAAYINNNNNNGFRPQGRQG